MYDYPHSTCTPVSWHISKQKSIVNWMFLFSSTLTLCQKFEVWIRLLLTYVLHLILLQEKENNSYGIHVETRLFNHT